MAELAVPVTSLFSTIRSVEKLVKMPYLSSSRVLTVLLRMMLPVLRRRCGCRWPDVVFGGRGDGEAIDDDVAGAFEVDAVGGLGVEGVDDDAGFGFEGDGFFGGASIVCRPSR